jgi:hypothetical protein
VITLKTILAARSINQMHPNTDTAATSGFSAIHERNWLLLLIVSILPWAALASSNVGKKLARGSSSTPQLTKSSTDENRR